MSRKIEIEKIEDLSIWDDFISKSPQGNIFSTSSWIETVSTATGAVPVCLGVFENGKISAGVNFLDIRKGFLKKATTPVLTPYGGLIFSPAAGKRESESNFFNMECSEKLINYLSSHYNYVYLVNTPFMNDIRSFSWAGFTEKVRYSYIIDIDNAEKVWDIMERRVRTVIRNASSSLEIGGALSAGHFRELYESIYKNQGVKPPVNPSVVEKIIAKAGEREYFDMITAKENGKVVSAMILLSYGDKIYSWLSGSLPEKNSTGAFSLLFWHAVEKYQAQGKTLDMVGANIPSIAFYKKGFGGVLTPYYAVEKYSSFYAKYFMKFYTGFRKLL